MKKLYFLTLLCLSTFSFGQNLTVNGGFESWTGGVVDTWTSESGTTVEEENTIFSEGAKSAKITVTTQTQGNTDFQQTINVVAGTTYDVSFDLYALDNQARARLVINNGFTFPYSDDSLLNQWQTVSDTYTATTTGPITIGIRFYDTAANWAGASVMYVDNFQFVAQSNPSLAVTSPSAGATIPSPNVNIELSVQNFTVATAGNGDGHIHYALDGGSVVMKYDTTPIALTALANGPHSLYIELVDDSHNPLSSPVNLTFNFTITSFNSVTFISDIRNDFILNGAGRYYELTGEALVTYTRANRNQKYIQDATAGILIDDNAGTITNTFNIGDGMTGLKGYTSEFSGVLQFVPYENISTSSTGNTITPIVVTAADITGNVEGYESQLVQINTATFTTADGTATFAGGTTYNLNDGASDIDFRTLFNEANYIGQIIPTAAQNIIVLVSEFNGTPQVVARSIADMPLKTTSFNAIEGLKMYPNPVSGSTLNIVTAANAETNVQIFDILGKEVVKTNVTNNQVNIANLNAGVYIVKVTEEGKTATRKLVVK